MDLDHIFDQVVIFSFHAFGKKIPVTQPIVMMWVIMAVMIILAVVFTRKFQRVPQGKQLVSETVVDLINKLMKQTIGKQWKRFAPYFGTILLFLVFSNIAGLFNIFPTGKQMYQWTGAEIFKNWNFTIEPPTSNLNIPLTLALMTVFLILLATIKLKGVKGYAKTFLEPIPVMLPFNILDYATRTLSLSLRLFGNVFAGLVIMELLYTGSVFVKPIVPVASAFFDLFDAALQAYIFVFLSSIYVSEAVKN